MLLSINFFENKATKYGYIFFAIKRRMDILPQSGLSAHKFLKERVGNCGYYQSEYTPGICFHKTRSIEFSLCVDGFLVKYAKEEDKKHLLYSLNQHYKVTVDDEGTQYLGITFE